MLSPASWKEAAERVWLSCQDQAFQSGALKIQTQIPFHGTDVLTGKELRKETAADGVGSPGFDPPHGQLVSPGETSEPRNHVDQPYTVLIRAGPLRVDGHEASLLTVLTAVSAAVSSFVDSVITIATGHSFVLRL